MIETTKNIYCLEGNWNNHPNSKQSIRPILDLLNTTYKVKYIYKKCLTKNDFLLHLEKFTYKRYKNYPILYLAFHGRRNKILIGNEYITLKEISNVLEGKLAGKFVHFGSCSTLGTSERNISSFISNTKCDFLSGYLKDVDYIESTAFELLFFELLQKYTFAKKVENIISKKYYSMKKNLNSTFINTTKGPKHKKHVKEYK